MRGSIIDLLPRYDRYMGGKGTLDVGYPWLSVGAILSLEKTIFDPAVSDFVPRRVLELGSGGSTIFFARRADHVLSIETDNGWAPKTLWAVEHHGLADKVDLRVVSNGESETLVASLPDASFDLLLVDHAADDKLVGRGARKAFSRLPLAEIAVPKLRDNGWLIIDNYAVHGMQNFDYAGWDTWVFDDLRYSGRGTILARRRIAQPFLRKRRYR